MATCLNCGNIFDGKYCNQCSQKSSTGRVQFGEILHDLPHTLFHVDKGIFYNLKGILNPAKTVNDYIKGKRVIFYNPFLFYLISLGLILLFQHLLDKSFQFAFSIDHDGKLIEAGTLVDQNMKFVCFASVFLFGLSSHWVFKKSTGYNYSEQVIANLFIATYANIVYLLLIWIPWDQNITYPINLSFVVLQMIFIFLVFKTDNIPLSIVKSILCVLLNAFLFLLGTSVISTIVYFIKIASL